MPVGDHVVAPGQHPVQGAGHGHLLGAGLGRDEALHQLVHHRVPDPGVVAAARRPGGVRGPVVALLVARGQVLVPASGHHVVVVLLQPAVVLGRVHGAARGGDAEPLQVHPHRSHDALVRRLHEEELEGHGLVRLLVDQGAVTYHPSGLAQHAPGLAQVGADRAVAVRGRGPAGLAEDLLRHSAAVPLQDLQLAAYGRTRGGQLGVGEVALGARVEPVEEGGVGPLEVEGVG